MSADQSQPSRYIFGKKEGFSDHNLSEPITDTTHVYMQKSNGEQPVKARKAEQYHPLGQYNSDYPVITQHYRFSEICFQKIVV